MENNEFSEKLEFDLKWNDEDKPEISFKISKKQDTPELKHYNSNVPPQCNTSVRIEPDEVGLSLNDLAFIYDVGTSNLTSCNPGFDWNNFHAGDVIYYVTYTPLFPSCTRPYAVEKFSQVTTLAQVCTKNNWSVDSFLKCNDPANLNPNNLEFHQTLYYAPVGVGCTLNYQIKKGDTKHLIEAITGATDAELNECNPNFDWNHLVENDKVFFKPMKPSYFGCENQ